MEYVSVPNSCYTPKRTKGIEKLQKGFRQIFLFIHVTGSPNYWHENVEWPPYVSYVTIQRISSFMNITSLIYVTFELTAFITQRNLDFQQMSFLSMCCISHVVNSLISSQSLVYYKGVLTGLVWKFLVKCPGQYYDEEVGVAALKQTRLYVIATVGLGCLAISLYGVQSIIIMLNDGIFSTFITVWPQVHDRSPTANIGRVVIYIVSVIWAARFFATLSTVFCITMCTRYQYKHVQSYFRNLLNIFKDDNLSQEEKELKYENGLKFGFMLHNEILNYTKEVVTICRGSFSAAVITHLAAFVIMMCKIFVGGRKPITEVLPDMVVIMVALSTTGCYMTTLGDLTFEAADVGDAMYCSGWENCGRGSAVRVRKLLGVGMAQTQRPLIISLFGVFPVSHKSFVSIVKASYSLFSLMYSTV